MTVFLKKIESSSDPPARLADGLRALQGFQGDRPDRCGGSGRPARSPGPAGDPHTESNEPAPFSWSITAALLNWGEMAANINEVNVPDSLLGDYKRTFQVPVARETQFIDGDSKCYGDCVFISDVLWQNG